MFLDGRQGHSAVTYFEACFRKKVEKMPEREMTEEDTGASSDSLSKDQPNVSNGLKWG